MDELIGQNFLITLIAPPAAPIGADKPPMRPGATAPVIIDGEMRLWTYREGYLVLEEGWYSTYDGNEVVVRAGVIEGTGWVFIRDERGAYLIKSPDEDTFWTASVDAPKQNVILAPKGSVNPEYQMWNFIPQN